MPLTRQQIERWQSTEIYWTGSDGVRVQICPTHGALPLELAPIVWGIAPGLLSSSPRAGGSPSTTPEFKDLLHRLSQAKISYEEAEFVVEGESYAGVLAQGISRTKAVTIGYKLRLWAVFGLTGTQHSVVYTGHNSRDRRG